MNLPNSHAPIELQQTSDSLRSSFNDFGAKDYLGADIMRDEKGKFVKGNKISEEQKQKIKESNRNRKISKETRTKMKLAKIGNKNPNWEGDNIKSITAIHAWVRRHKPKPALCVDCKKRNRNGRINDM